MGIAIKWFDESQTIILFTIQDPWTWEQNHHVTEQSFQMIETVDGVVDYIVDLRQASLKPQHVFSNFRHMMHQTHPREGCKYMVGASGFMLTVTQVFRRINPKVGEDYIFVDTITEAVECLTASRQYSS